jgi:sugar lactone lactonase YvrE
MADGVRVDRVTPPAGIAGGRVYLEGEGLAGEGGIPPVVQVAGRATRPLFASGRRIIAPIPEEAPSGPVSVGEAVGPVLIVGRKLAGDLNPVANPAVNSHGTIYTTFSGRRGQRVPVPLFAVTPEGEISPLPAEIQNPTGLAFDPAGNLVVSSRADGTVCRVGRDGGVDVVAQDLGTATGIVFDPAGNLYVGDRSGPIHRVDPAGGITRFAELPPSVAAFHLAWGPDGSLYATAPTLSNADPIYRIETGGRVTTVATGLARPQGLAFDARRRLYVVAIQGTARGVLRLDGEAFTWVVAGENLVGLAFDPTGALILASTDAIYRLAPFDVG